MRDWFWALMCNIRDSWYHMTGRDCPGHLLQCPEWSASMTCRECGYEIKSDDPPTLIYRAAIHTKNWHQEAYLKNKDVYDDMIAETKDLLKYRVVRDD